MKESNDKEKLIEQINNVIKNFDDYDTPFYITLSCYYLWLIKKNSLNVSPIELEEIILGKQNIQFTHMAFFDLLEGFSDYEELWKQFVSLSNEYSIDIIEEIVSDIDQYSLGERFEPLPSGIAFLADRILNVSNKDKVLNVFSGAGEYARTVYDSHPNARYFCYDDNYSLQTVASVISEVNNYSNITFVCDEYEEKDFDKVIVTPAFGIKAYKTSVKYYIPDVVPEFPIECSDAWNQTIWGVYSAKKTKKVVSIMDGGQLTVQQTKDARQYMCDHKYIEGVISLPSKMYSGTWISPYLVIMGNNCKDVRFMDASHLYIEGRVRGKRVNYLSDEIINQIVEKYNSKEDTVHVTYEEISKNGYNLNPSRYIREAQFSEKYVLLGDVITGIRRGMTLSGSKTDELVSTEPSEYKCIIPSSISTGVIQTYFYYQGELKKNNKNMAHRNSVLISKTGNPCKIALSDKNYLIVGNIYIVDIDIEKIRPEYVWSYLSSKKGQEEINRYAVGPNTPVINISDLSKIRIPIYSDNKMKEMQNQSQSLYKEIDNCYKQITENKNEIDLMFD